MHIHTIFRLIGPSLDESRRRMLAVWNANVALMTDDEAQAVIDETASAMVQLARLAGRDVE